MIGYSGRVREPLAYVAKVQSQWEKRVLKSLNSMCMELGQSLAKPRCQNEQQELLSKFLQNYRTTDLQIYRLGDLTNIFTFQLTGTICLTWTWTCLSSDQFTLRK